VANLDDLLGGWGTEAYELQPDIPTSSRWRRKLLHLQRYLQAGFRMITERVTKEMRWVHKFRGSRGWICFLPRIIPASREKKVKQRWFGSTSNKRWLFSQNCPLQATTSCTSRYPADIWEHCANDAAWTSYHCELPARFLRLPLRNFDFVTCNQIRRLQLLVGFGKIGKQNLWSSEGSFWSALHIRTEGGTSITPRPSQFILNMPKEVGDPKFQ